MPVGTGEHAKFVRAAAAGSSTVTRNPQRHAWPHRAHAGKHQPCCRPLSGHRPGRPSVWARATRILHAAKQVLHGKYRMSKKDVDRSPPTDRFARERRRFLQDSATGAGAAGLLAALGLSHYAVAQNAAPPAAPAAPAAGAPPPGARPAPPPEPTSKARSPTSPRRPMASASALPGPPPMPA